MMAEEATQASADGKAAEQTTTPPTGGRTTSEFKDIADAVRSRTDLFGKTLGAIATLGVTAVGLAKIGDLFPIDGNGWWAALACIGLVAAGVAAIWIAVRLMKVARPVFTDPDLTVSTDLNEDEQSAVKPVYDAAAKRFGYTSLVGLQERERSLRDAASWTTDKDERARRTALADEVKSEIEQALARGQVVTVRHRSTNAVTGFAWVLYITVILGLIAFAIGTDKVSSDRMDAADAKACAEARKAGATKEELQRANCEPEAQKPEEEPKPPSAAEARAQITTKLAAALEACAALVEQAGDPKSGPLKDEDCDAVREALSSMSGATP
jgi:hypothetical protein